MKTLLAWLAMGGYAPYVWSSYGLVLGVLLMQGLGVVRFKKQTRTQLSLWFNR